MKREIVFRSQAKRDLKDIWHYTRRAWDASQADRYVAAIRAAVEAAAENPGIGSDRGDVRPGMKKLSAGSHAIYYFDEGDRLRIARILHVRMDVGPAL